MACLSASGPCVYTVLRVVPALKTTFCKGYMHVYIYEPVYYEAVENTNQNIWNCIVPWYKP